MSMVAAATVIGGGLFSCNQTQIRPGVISGCHQTSWRKRRRNPTDINRYAKLLQLCVDGLRLREAQQLQARLMVAGLIQQQQSASLWTKLVSLYCLCGFLDEARKAFQEGELHLHTKIDDVYLWNIIIKAHVRHGRHQQALLLFYQMHVYGFFADAHTFSSALKSCAALRDLQTAKQIHAHIIKNGFGENHFVATTLLDLYAKCGCVEAACAIFHSISEQDSVLWGALLAAYAHNCKHSEAIRVFRRFLLQQGFRVTEILLANVAMASLNLRQGQEIHGFAIKHGHMCGNIRLCNRVLGMYKRFGRVNDARQVFDEMPAKNAASWASLISAYVHANMSSDALQLFYSSRMIMPRIPWCSHSKRLAFRTLKHSSGTLTLPGEMSMEAPSDDLRTMARMELEGLQQKQKQEEADDIMVTTAALSACADMASLNAGQEIHAFLIKTGALCNQFVVSTLIDMYGKCGNVSDAWQVFHQHQQRNVVCITAMIVAYGLNGHGREAIALFRDMLHGGHKPNLVSFLGVLTACSHSGLVKEGLSYFDSMEDYSGLVPGLRHYTCVVDLLGRAGRLQEAWLLISSMPMEPDAAVWGALLNACRIHHNVELGELAAHKLQALEPHNPGNSLLMSYIYASAGRWVDVAKVRAEIKEKWHNLRTGFSWIEVRNRVHVFGGVDDDTAHLEWKQIRSILDDLTKRIKEAGYVPASEFGQTENNLCNHSERLAISFGLISSCPSKPIRVNNSLRMCNDCHNAAKFMSVIADREIVVRDTHRFHRFKDGACSCGDYW